MSFDQLLRENVIPGAVKHAIITDDCRRNKGDEAVMEEALQRLRDAWPQVANVWTVGKGARFHVALICERAASVADEGAPPALVAAEETKDGWISLEEREPPERVRVLVWFPQAEAFGCASLRKSSVFGCEWIDGQRRWDWKAGTLWKWIKHPLAAAPPAEAATEAKQDEEGGGE